MAAELGGVQHQQERLRRGLLHEDGQQGCPARHGGMAAGPLVHLARGHAGQLGSLPCPRRRGWAGQRAPCAGALSWGSSLELGSMAGATAPAEAGSRAGLIAHPRAISVGYHELTLAQAAPKLGNRDGSRRQRSPAQSLRHRPGSRARHFIAHKQMRWPHLFGQVGGENKLVPGSGYAAVFSSAAVVRACPDNSSGNTPRYASSGVRPASAE